MTETAAVLPAPVKINRSKLILAAFKTLPGKLNAKANEVVAHVKEQAGVDVTVSLINNLRSRLRKAQEERSARKRTTVAPTPVVANPLTDNLNQLVAVKEFAAKVGGLENLKSLVATLEAVQNSEALKALVA